MDAFIKTVIMGIVEGITEFLPISSTGHLLLANHLIGFDEAMGSAEAAKAFEIIVQLGAILAVVFVFPRRFAMLLQVKDHRGLAGLRGLALLAITSLPIGILGLCFDKQIDRHLMSTRNAPIVVSAAFVAGALWMLAVEWRRPKARVLDSDAMTWKEALWMGLYQALALWPGMSRSASTILGGMMSGVERKTAAEYSFLAAVPIMLAATALKIVQHSRDFSAGQLNLLAVGFVVSFITAWIAVKLFVRFLGRHTLISFAVYRLLAAAAVWTWMIRPGS